MEIINKPFREEFTGGQSPWFEYRNRGQSVISCGVGGATLVLPENPLPFPDESPQLQTPFLCAYGTYEARLKAAGSERQRNAGVVTGLFTYANDGVTDTGATGVPDNSEIDFEWLAAKPDEIILSVWTKYRACDGEQRRATRIINLAEGKFLHTRSYENFGLARARDLSGKENVPETVRAIPGYDASSHFHTYGFEWRADRVIWWIEHPDDGKRIILWDYSGAAQGVPANPARFMANVWHTPSWAPDGMPDAIERPKFPVSIGIEWMKYTP